MDYKPVEQEKDVLKFWEDSKILEKARKKGQGKKPFYFLDGPPYTSGKIHLGTAWNKSLKDIVTRYKRMKGFDVWDRAGYDMHGLPTEGKVQAKLGMKTKADIEAFGMEKFVTECRDFAVTNLKQMNKDFKRLGVWLDFDNAYQTIDNEYIEGTWWLVKKAHEKNRLYQGEMTMTWCGSCQTSLAKHELEYKEVVDKSIFVKFKVKGKEDEFLVIWTTTPWTIAFNLGVMANPDVDYIRAKVGKETWIVAKELADSLIKTKLDEDYQILETFKGKTLEGLEYTHPMEDILKHHYQEIRKKAKKLHVVVMSAEYVTTEHGTGLVHMAPGCGPEDYEVGHLEGIPPFSEVDEEGYYSDTMGQYSKLHVKKDNEKFIVDLEKRGALAAKEDYKHDYAHCWRCKNPVLYRTTTQWFFKVEDLIPKMRKLNREKMYWVPDWAGANQFDSWLENLRDNGITRQRYWGSPLPVWMCGKCKSYVVAESRKDLEKMGASHIPDDLHKPWIDQVTIPCRKCNTQMKRIPDIMDVWIDAGVDSWASLGFPRDETLFRKLFPADFITEGKDQIRGWFNLLFVASMLAMEDISFKACYMTGFVNDSMGRKMSKSLGNVISPDEVTDKYGADTWRYYSIGATAPGLDLNYNFEDIELKRRNLTILWNLHSFVMDTAKNLGKNPEKIPSSILKHAEEEERYIFSKLNSTIKRMDDLMDKYYLNDIPSLLEEMYLELSRTYIQMVREKISSGTDEEKELVLYTVYHVLKETVVLMAPLVPMITELIYQNFKKEFGLSEESVHLCDWPVSDAKKIDLELENDIVHVKGIVQAMLNAREKAQVGVRWPLAEVIIETADADTEKAAKDMEGLIEKLVNVKKLVFVKKFEKADVIIKPNYKTLGPEFGKESKDIIKFLTDTENSKLLAMHKDGKMKLHVAGKDYVLEDRHLVTEKTLPKGIFLGEFTTGNVFLEENVSEELLAEGFSRELMRRIQSARKDAGLKKVDVIDLHVSCEKKLADYLLQFKDAIQERVGARALDISAQKHAKKHTTEIEDSIKGLKFSASFTKV
ncbi:MAG: isoleucine--tRNA ligase [Nanoarchaeota archaeon]|nr:isoleucine--tRNA ligase [Nanoarchaeota archaeon]